MAIFEITDNTTGFVFEIEGDQPPTQQEARDLIAGMDQEIIQITPTPSLVVPPTTEEEPGALESGFGALEAAGTIATGLLAEPAAGLAGVITAPFIGSERATEVIDRTREFFTFQPRTEAGKESLESVGEFLAPVSQFITDAERNLGDTVFEKTGSPFLASIATTIPTIGAELVGIGIAKGVGRAGRFAKEREVKGALRKAAPEPEQLFNISRGIYDELDNLGVTVKPQPYLGFVNRVEKKLIKNGLNNIITPKSFRALQELKKRTEGPGEVSLTEVNTLRKIAQNAAESLDPPEKMLGNIIIDEIDNFLSFNENAFNKPRGLDVNISERFKIARNLWGRGRKSNAINEAMTIAEDSATGFENGLRNQLRNILRSPAKRNFFNKSEISDMRQMVRGTKGTNLLKFLGKFGFSEGQAINIVGGSLGLTAGFLVGGGTGAAAVTAIGSGARFLSKVVGENKAKMFNSLIRARRDGLKITKAYLENTPKGKRSTAELAELLIGDGVDLSKLPKSKFVNEAAEIAAENRAAITRGVVTTEIIRDPRLSLSLSLGEEE